MASKSEQPKRCDRVLSALDELILVLNLAKDTCGIPPAQIAFGSASALLEMIRVRSLLFCGYDPLVYACSGLHGQQWVLRRTRETMHWCM